MESVPKVVGSAPPREAPDLAWWRDPAGHTTPLPRPRSVYVETRDGVRLAVDVYLPAAVAEGETVPAILIQTRYFRRCVYKPWAGALGPLLGREGEVAPFVAGGYAVVVVDARGSGASFGYRTSEISAEEVADGADVCDWIIRQPWSSGVIGSTGVSYEGSTAEALLRTRHPAVKAAVIRCSLFDYFVDIFAPGGVRTSWFIRDWAALVDAKDRNEQEETFAGILGGAFGVSLMLAAGVAPVDGDADGSLLAAAVAAHRDNYDLVNATRAIQFRDDIDPLLASEEEYHGPVHSPVLFLDDIIASGAAIYSWCGWYDGAFVNSAVKRWVALRDHGCRLILGPWDHGSRQLPDPTTLVPVPSFDHVGEVVRFFDAHLKGQRNAIVDEPPVHYYTVGEGRWKACATWPPPGFASTPLYFGEHRALTRRTPADEKAADTYRVDFRATSGLGSRWRAQANLHGAVIGWPDRAEQDALLLVYDSEPLKRDLEVTGHPVLTLYLTVDGTDTAVHAYLEDVTSEGDVRHVTEGILRAVNRAEHEGPRPWDRLEPYHTFLRSDARALVPGEVAALRFGLQPCSYLFRAGSRIRLALAGADADNFERIPAVGPAPSWHVQRTAAHPSHITLPALEHI